HIKAAGPSVTEKPTNGSVHLDLDLEDVFKNHDHIKAAGPSVTEKPTNGSVHLDLYLEDVFKNHVFDYTTNR
nr:hypothetical protein [Tanacetum cinerariifolium]